VEWTLNVRPEGLTDNAVLLGSAAWITDVLKHVEAAGFDEVILYFNVGPETARTGEGRNGALRRAGIPSVSELTLGQFTAQMASAVQG
jgi:hypothetical protein